MRPLFSVFLALLLWIANSPIIHVSAAPQAVVHAVLFYSPSCGHCHYVIEEVLPPLMQKYGDQFQIIGVDVSQQEGSNYFNAAIQKFNLQSAGVPFLVIGNDYLMGSVDIPEKLPGLIEKYLALGGVDFPDIPELREKISASSTAQAPTPSSAAESNPNPETAPTEAADALEPGKQNQTPAPTAAAETSKNPTSESSITEADNPFGLDNQDKTSVWERVARDPLGNGLAIVILVLMLAVATFSVLNFRTPQKKSSQPWPAWLIPSLSLAGFLVAGYLAYVETAQVTAVCGPVGDCNTVQQSEYARLFGFLPIGVLGLLGYVGIVIAWLVGSVARKPLSQYADLALMAMTTFGLAFSIYLTFLEPFVIGATCAWCLTSAVIMTALFWLSQKSAKRARNYFFHTKGSTPKA